jgi:hypothetical protein
MKLFEGVFGFFMFYFKIISLFLTEMILFMTKIIFCCPKVQYVFTCDGIRASSSGLREVSPKIGATELPKSDPTISDPSPDVKNGFD